MSETPLPLRELEHLVLAALIAQGSPDSVFVRAAANAVVEAERLNQPEFGIRLLLRELQRSDIRWELEPTIQRSGAIGVMNAAESFAPLALAHAAQLAADQAELHGCGVVVVTDPGGLGRLAPHTAGIAERGLIGVITVGSKPLVAPHGGHAAALGTNPISAAIPSIDGPIVVDSAISLLTKGKWESLHAIGSPLPTDSAIDDRGHPVTDAEAVAAFLPKGGHYGTVMGVVVEALTNGVAGYLGSGDHRAALVVALRSLELEATAHAVGGDLRQRLTRSGGHTPGSSRRHMEQDVRVDAGSLRELRDWCS